MAPMILSAAAHGAFMRAFLTMALGDSPLWKSVGRGTAFWWKEFQKWRRKEWTGTRLQVRAFSPPPKMVNQTVFSYISPVSCRVICLFCSLLSHVMVLRFSLSYVMVLCFYCLIPWLCVVNLDQHWGAVHSKRLLKSPFSVFFGRFLQEFNVKKMNSESLFPNAGWQINAGLAP